MSSPKGNNKDNSANFFSFNSQTENLALPFNYSKEYEAECLGDFLLQGKNLEKQSTLSLK